MTFFSAEKQTKSTDNSRLTGKKIYVKKYTVQTIMVTHNAYASPGNNFETFNYASIKYNIVTMIK